MARVVFNRFCFLVLALAACSSGQGGGDTSTPTPSPDATSDPLLPYIEYTQMDDDLQAQHSNLAYTDDGDLPKTGTADYAGVMRLITALYGQPTQMAGNLDLSVDFAASTLLGNASGFKDALNTAFGGALAITNGVIDRNADPDWEYRFFADIDGTLTGAGTSLTINADLYGDFHGTDGQSVAGGLAGRPSGQNVGDYLYGTFAAQK